MIKTIITQSNLKSKNTITNSNDGRILIVISLDKEGHKVRNVKQKAENCTHYSSCMKSVTFSIYNAVQKYWNKR